VDAAQAGVDAIRYGDVDDAVLAGQRHGGLRAFLRQREETRAGTATHDDGERLFSDGGPVGQLHRGIEEFGVRARTLPEAARACHLTIWRLRRNTQHRTSNIRRPIKKTPMLKRLRHWML